MPPPREIRLFTADELERIAAELVQVAAAAVRFAAATGLRPRSGPAVERRDVDKARRIINVRGTKTLRSRREVPLTRAALDALEQVPPRLDSRHVFTTSRKCPGRVSLARSTSPTSDAASGPRDRHGRRGQAGSAVRPPLHVRLERSRGRDHDVRARSDHGHQCQDDRTALRHVD